LTTFYPAWLAAKVSWRTVVSPALTATLPSNRKRLPSILPAVAALRFFIHGRSSGIAISGGAKILARF
jgi:hypothetical protein